MKFGEIIKSNSWLSVEMVLVELYPDQKKSLAGYESMFSRLKTLQPEETGMSILVEWVKDDFDQTDYVNVSGYYNNPDEGSDELTSSYAIEFTPWGKWLGMDIDPDTLETFTELEIIAYCLYEMTFCGFDEETIQTEYGRIIDAAEEVKNMTEEEKKEKLKSWEDLKKELDLDNDEE